MASPKSEETEARWLPELPDGAHQRTIDPRGDLILVSNCPDTCLFKVSSNVLCLASKVFQNLLICNESQRPATTLEIGIAFTTDAIEILLRIIHLQMRCIPERLPRMHLLDIARLVDCYEMQDSLGPFLELWINNSFYITYAMADEESALDWLYIMFVFDEHFHFTMVASHLMWTSTGIDLEDAPEGFRSVLANIEANEIRCERDFYLQSWLNSIHKDYKAYVGSSECQNRTCTAQEFVLGYFTRLLEKYQLLCPPQPPYKGVTLNAVSRIFIEFREGLEEAPPCPVGNRHYRVMEERPQSKDCKLFKIENFKPYRPHALIPFYGP
ncbi:hypothetical protein BDDG_07741 [Blastomyces dermatitidis ATCC 18188]|uniref:BTB domain-containing protein n=1 Tax=Ajellomyces dermatitidis (strain ATCC 18188 / CBS 674.68) TaxID=653446 RepID=F2TNI3_AJEDA|nr:hypothetical protein BDDG_07741 [Blastomyces dermatitidis ATCC 18188]